MDRDLSIGYCYPSFEQLEPEATNSKPSCHPKLHTHLLSSSETSFANPVLEAT